MLQAGYEYLAHRERHFRALIENTSDLTSILDAAGRFLYVSPPVQRFLAYEQQALLGRSAFEFMHPDDVARMIGVFERVSRQPGLNPPAEFRFRHRDGTWRYVEVRGTNMLDDPDIAGIVINAHDITERKQGEAELREYQQRLEELVAERTTELRAATAEAQKARQTAEALRAAGLELTAVLDLDALLRSIVMRAVDLLHGASGSLYLYRAETDVLEWAISVGGGIEPVPGSVRRRGEGLSGKVWESGHAQIVNDYANWSERPAIYAGHTFTAAVAVPIRWGDEFLGTLKVLAEPPSRFTDADADLLSLFASHAAIAIINARSYEDAQAEQLRLAALSEQLAREKRRADDLLHVVIPLGASLAAEQDLSRLLDRIIQAAMSFCHADAGVLYLRTRDDRLEYVVVRNQTLGITTGQVALEPLELFDRATGAPNHRHVVTHAALVGQTVNTPDAGADEEYDYCGAEVFGCSASYCPISFLTIPLAGSDRRVIGVLQLINAQDESGRVVPFDADLQQLVESMSLLAAAALEAYQREHELRREIAQLRIELDEAAQRRQVAEITESEYFQQLQARAQDIRKAIDGL